MKTASKAAAHFNRLMYRQFSVGQNIETLKAPQHLDPVKSSGCSPLYLAVGLAKYGVFMNSHPLNENENNVGVYYNKKDYAGFTRRLLIVIIDLIVLFIISFALLYISDTLTQRAGINLSYNHGIFAIIFLSGFYLSILKGSKYRTIGYILAGVKIVNLQGKKPSIVKMALRTGLLLIGPFELFFGIIWLTSETTRQTLRDKYVGTYVIKKHAVPAGNGKLKTVMLTVMGWNLSYREVGIEHID